MSLRLAIIGFGAITEEVVRTLEQRGQLETLAAVLVRPARLAEATRKAAGRFAVVDNLDDLCRLQPGIVVECAGHAAMRQFGAEVLQRGLDLLCSSVGALADEAFAKEMARHSDRAQLWIPSGAVAGIDGLLAARSAGLRTVTYTSIKPPAAWIGTAAETMLAGCARDQRITVFSGTARQAAIAYPQNVNVGATVALAGLGLDRTTVHLVSDPSVSGPLGMIEAAGDFGSFRFDILAYASPHNPKTSLLTAHSIIAAVQTGVCFAPFAGDRGPSDRRPRRW